MVFEGDRLIIPYLIISLSIIPLIACFLFVGRKVAGNWELLRLHTLAFLISCCGLSTNVVAALNDKHLFIYNYSLQWKVGYFEYLVWVLSTKSSLVCAAHVLCMALAQTRGMFCRVHEGGFWRAYLDDLTFFGDTAVSWIIGVFDARCRMRIMFTVFDCTYM